MLLQLIDPTLPLFTVNLVVPCAGASFDLILLSFLYDSPHIISGKGHWRVVGWTKIKSPFFFEAFDLFKCLKLTSSHIYIFLDFNFNKFKVNEIHEMDKANVEIHSFLCCHYHPHRPKSKKIVGIVACVAVLPVDSVRCVWGSRRESVSVLLADNIELPLSAHPTQSKLWGINSAWTGVELKADSFV